VKYLISASEFLAPSRVLSEVVEQHRAEKIWGFGADTFRIGQENQEHARPVQHPPSNRHLVQGR